MVKVKNDMAAFESLKGIKCMPGLMIAGHIVNQ